ncbi:Ethylene-responsive transcription factor ERF025 [Striga hermonthica]|uniref:Ethylene-responsive transcription factor ERF025 n=1 Tax=Striga hermonthica TaxID=68872 RepID=A0A9N7NGS9_STRHE|nr:Ethylene-responsive transcription factor ERF025 [Striga hermonthica]
MADSSHYHSQPPHQNETLPSHKKAKKTTKTGGGTTSTTGKHPTYHGIRRRGEKWVSEIREPRKTTRIWLGTYPSPEMAAAAYDVAALALKGGNVALNLPGRAGSFPVPLPASPEEIQRAAARAAEMMGPAGGGGVGVVVAAAEGRDWPVESNSLASGVGGYDEYVDEDALFDMPNLLVDMAEGMLVSPPRMGSPPLDEWPGGQWENLWSYY